MNKLNAKNTIFKISKINQSLNEIIIQTIKINPNAEELFFYKRAVGSVMGEIHDRLLKPIFEEYPDLIPDELRGNC